ncbi:hypothetical protein ATG98_3505 [Marinobacter sp. LV10R520-4]|uniref:hypothetical protein n=1 Tax=Marinobacter sp. LV10R520-4 TaxID=1761796 RepID=UPI000BF8DD11|nr:hypothetical protein [Marinobacter sp. LV10R520-4]PFG54285.1 hypothetical protein ATG98_3505 [Marinobacter sp. LV10R520-4]
MILSAYGEDLEMLESINNGMLEHPLVGRVKVVELSPGRNFYVAEDTDRNFLFYFIPCYTEDDAYNMAQTGVPVLDLDKSYGLLGADEQKNFVSHMKYGFYENSLVDYIVVRIDQMSIDASCNQRLPFKFYRAYMPVLKPHEYELIKNGIRPSVNITINTTTATIHCFDDDLEFSS